MRKILIALLGAGLLFAFGCDEPAEEPEVDEAEMEVDEAHETDDEMADDEHDEMADDEHDEMADGDEADTADVVTAEDGVVEITATANSFEPSAIEAPAGEALELQFTRTTEDGCMTEVVFPEMEREEELPYDETVTVELTPEEGQVIDFECGMGMGESTVTGT